MLEAELGTTDWAAEEAGCEEAVGLLEAVSLDLTSLGSAWVEDSAFEELVLDDFVSELFFADDAEDVSLDSAVPESTELAIEFSEAGEITGPAGKIGAFSPAELNEPEAGAQPIISTSTIRIETIFFIFFVNSPKDLRYRLIIPKSRLRYNRKNQEKI